MKKKRSADHLTDRVSGSFYAEQVAVIFPDVLGAELVGRAVEVTRESSIVPT